MARAGTDHAGRDKSLLYPIPYLLSINDLSQGYLILLKIRLDTYCLSMTCPRDILSLGTGSAERHLASLSSLASATLPALPQYLSLATMAEQLLTNSQSTPGGAAAAGKAASHPNLKPERSASLSPRMRIAVCTMQKQQLSHSHCCLSGSFSVAAGQLSTGRGSLSMITHASDHGMTQIVGLIASTRLLPCLPGTAPPRPPLRIASMVASCQTDQYMLGKQPIIRMMDD